MNYTSTADATIASSSMAVVGDTICVAITAIAKWQTGGLSIQGVFSLPKASATVLVQGDNAFWYMANKLVVAATNTDAVPLGRVHNVPGAATTVQVKINA